MKLVKKIVATVFAIAVAVTCLTALATEVQAAPKTTTYVIDKKSGVWYPTKIRVGIQERGNTTNIYMPNEGDYIASVKTSSSNLIAKVTERISYKEDNYTTVYADEKTSYKMKQINEITFFAKKAGTYTATVTIKDVKKKTVCKKKIKVYAEDFSYALKTFKYGGKYYYGTNIITKKASGKLEIALNKGFKLQKIEVGTYQEGEYEDYTPEPVFKTVKNKKKISLATSTKYNSGVDEYSYGSYSRKSGYATEFLYPITIVRITYKDQKLGTVHTMEYDIFYQNK